MQKCGNHLRGTLKTAAQAAQAVELDQPPLAPPVALYANLPIEWPLARISVYTRHISVLLRVTLNRRLAELSFRGVEFRHLPREVIRHTREDFDAICGCPTSRPVCVPPTEPGAAAEDRSS